MSETSFSLLERLRDNPDEQAWKRLVDLYTPLLRHWLNRYFLPEADAEDLIQDVMAALVQDLSKFQHNGNPGAFRSWLRTILLNRLKGYWRSLQGKPQATGGANLSQNLEQFEDPSSGLSILWDTQHDQYVMRQLLQQIEPQVTPTTWEAFRRVALDGKDEALVAKELGISLNAVFIAKSRVLARLRREAKGLID
ncbi:MAG TPA: sigma-70 family RNA polymerase sigma factor [Gemmataceae bacterium]|nr:sigma-70 family RNA polymerase sigma factor [Gemmataceae bacterium]